ncbi:KpsF/GutQ family sugar-phosphate isomerase [Desulfatibacillum aliphaticivorans]|uniref:KpsF/GutQ family sugar-phosphate isomerase n=1 Tax=Desulfatibacillum aliphaticivorans TaxID=218208 RepID=UPI0004197CCD|nr:KpsF/GutQ family sugar-phosphate isomerase [Desulfatibacillum aliphaticivorans]
MGQTTIEQAKEVLKIEAEGVLELVEKIDEGFSAMVDLIMDCKGRVIVGGIGKSGIVGRKIVATLNSTGTRSMFLHPVEAMHGDLGMVCEDDLFLALSNSGETDELNILVPSIQKAGCKVIAFTGNVNSTLAKYSDIVIDVGVKREACPLGLAPTSSTTALLAIGDALAVVLINKRNFKSSDFKRFHPGGHLGQRLSAKIKDIMLTGDDVPCVLEDTIMTEAIAEMDRLDLGTTLVTDKDGALKGIITDGDLRRFLTRGNGVDRKTAKDVMTPTPKAVTSHSKVSEALNLMEAHLITVLPVVGEKNQVLGILHVHDILGKGEVRFNGH